MFVMVMSGFLQHSPSPPRRRDPKAVCPKPPSWPSSHRVKQRAKNGCSREMGLAGSRAKISEKWKREQPVSGPSPPGAGVGPRSDPGPSGAGIGSRRCCLVSKKVKSASGSSLFFQLFTFHFQLLESCPNLRLHPQKIGPSGSKSLLRDQQCGMHLGGRLKTSSAIKQQEQHD
jgi:hypothetical protein